jgi:glycosyltransferase involved in cell wall biosynthesis
MEITVILCTFNRCRTLAKALESIAASTLPRTVAWEVLVVDNNSSDQTRALVEEFCRRQPGRFRYLFEPQQGLSYARNTGVREARGDIICFVDDDVMVDPAWLQNLTETLHDDEWAGAGGRICLEQNFSPPSWLPLQGPYSMGGQLAALFDLGDKPSALDRPPHGTNMAYRKAMFEKYGGFRTDLGRCGNNLIGQEDVEFGERLMAGGERLWYAPSALVYHPVQQERLTKEYFLAWWFGCGQAIVRQRGRRLSKWGIPRYYLSMGMLAISLLRWMCTLNRQRRFFRKCWTWMYAGKVVENYRQSRHEKLGSLARFRAH